MLQQLQAVKKGERAQGMTEYIIIVALIALVAVAGVRLFGNKLSGMFNSQAEQLDKVATPTQ
jgi:Flp pilus assembly pilin Flp